MLNFIKSKLIASSEYKKVQEQYKEFFTFLNRYGYALLSKDLKIVREEHEEYNIDHVQIEIIWERNADLVSIGKFFYEKTKLELPLFPDLNATQFLGIRLSRINNEYHPYYEVYNMGFGILKYGFIPTHHNMFRNPGNYNTWPINGFPSSGCKQEFYNHMQAESLKECVNKLIRSIKYYNTDNWASTNDWYLDYMIKNHPNIIPILT